MKELKYAEFKPVDRKAVLLLNRPPLNILTQAMCEELTGFLKALPTDDYDGLLITTAGQHFSAGADIDEHFPEKVGEMLPGFNELLLTLAEFPLPTVAAITGSCLGGGLELARACRQVIAWNPETIVLGQPEIKLGCFPPFGLAVFPRLLSIYPNRLNLIKFLLTGEILKGKDVNQFLEAQALGIINVSFFGTIEELIEGFHPLDFSKEHPIPYLFQGPLDINEKVVMMALSEEVETIGKLSNHALKLAVDVLIHCSKTPDLRSALEHAEEVYLTKLVPHPDYDEGLTARKEKRPATFVKTGWWDVG